MHVDRGRGWRSRWRDTEHAHTGDHGAPLLQPCTYSQSAHSNGSNGEKLDKGKMMGTLLSHEWSTKGPPLGRSPEYPIQLARTTKSPPNLSGSLPVCDRNHVGRNLT